MATQTAMEAWLGTSDFDTALSRCFTKAQHGGGSHGRNISEDVLLETCVGLVSELPGELAQLPPPDEQFVQAALASTLPDIARAGVRDEETLSTCVQVVLLQLAAATDKLADMVVAEHQAQ